MCGFQSCCLLVLPITVTLTVFLSAVQASNNKAVLRAQFPTAWASNISPLCFNDSRIYLQSYLNQEKWASQMYKATGVMSIEGFKNMNDVFMSSSGLFDECISVESPLFQGQYCSIFFKVAKLPTFQTSNDGNVGEKSQVKFTEERDGDGNTYSLPRVGFCIPSSCSPIDFRSSIAQLVDHNRLDAGTSQTNSLISVVTDENYCYTRKKIDSQQFDALDIFILFALSLLATLVLLGTLYDGWRSYRTNYIMDSKITRVLVCFSALENGRKVLSTKNSPSDLSCLHGIRFLSATWIILFHTYLFIIVRQINIKFGPDNKNVMYEWDGQALTRGSIAVDTFFVMGGLLVSYSLLRELKRNNGRFNPFSFYFHRFLRISPVYFLYLGFSASLLVYTSNGPIWHYIQQERDMCRTYWWTHVLFIKNYFMQFQCVGQAWYLAADMQLFLLSPIFIYPMWKWRRAGLAWTIFTIVALVGTIGAIYIVWSLPVTELRLERSVETAKSLYPNLFFDFWARLPQYLVGVLLGWILYKLNSNENQRLILNWIGVVSGWILCITTIVVVIYGMFPYLNEELIPLMNPFIRVAYGTLSNVGWALAISWIIFACVNGYGGLVNSFLSWKGFMPLSRLSFNAYIVHQNLIKAYIGYSRMPFYYTRVNLAIIYLVVVMVSFMLAFILSITIELPFINLDREFWTVKSKNNNRKEDDLKEVKENPEQDQSEKTNSTTTVL